MSNKFHSPRRSNAEAEVLIEANRGLIGRVIKANFPGLDWDEAFSVGMRGLSRAAQLFDDTRGFKFSTYATRAIFGALKAHVEEEFDPRFEGLAAEHIPATFDQDTLADAEERERHHAVVQKIIAKTLRRLTARERSILLRRGAGETLKQIGDSLGVGRERVRQIQRTAIQKIHRLPNFRSLKKRFVESAERVA